MKDYMTTGEVQTLFWIEEYWHRNNGSFPSKDIINKECPVDLDTCLKKESFKVGLANRGITIGKQNGLLPEQISAVILVTDYSDRRSLQQKLRSLGIKSATWNGWLRSDRFRALLFNSSQANFEDGILAAREGLIRAAERGDVQAIKFFMEITGRYNPRGEETADFKRIIIKLLEVIARHETPEKMQLIEQDFAVEIAKFSSGKELTL